MRRRVCYIPYDPYRKSHLIQFQYSDRLGRRILICGAMIFGGSCCLLSMILLEVSELENDALAIAATWFSFAGKFGISASSCAIYVYAAELFPTDIRTTGLGFASMVGRIGGIAAPFIILLPRFTPNLIFALSGIVSGLSVLLLPETKNKPLLQTLNQAKSFYSGKIHIAALVKQHLKMSLNSDNA